MIDHQGGIQRDELTRLGEAKGARSVNLHMN